jgi:hypothetical protein
MDESAPLENAAPPIPSMIDDDMVFLEEFDRLEVRGIPRPLVTPAAIPRDANRWNLYPLPGAAPAPRAPRLSAGRSAWLPIGIGLLAGAAMSAAIFHERIALIFAHLAR